jgi:hypothetical protein
MSDVIISQTIFFFHKESGLQRPGFPRISKLSGWPNLHMQKAALLERKAA